MRIICFIIFYFCCELNFAQSLIPNGDFEEFKKNFNKEKYASGNYSGDFHGIILKNILSWETFDLQRASLNDYYSLSRWSDFYVKRSEGNDFCGFIESQDFNSSYLYCCLPQPLKKGKYILKYQLTGIQTGGATCESVPIQFLFSSKPIKIKKVIKEHVFSLYIEEAATCQSVLPSYLCSALPMKTFWVTFDAKGGEQYFYIGKFGCGKAVKEFLKKPEQGNSLPSINYFIDNISLESWNGEKPSSEISVPDTANIKMAPVDSLIIFTSKIYDPTSKKTDMTGDECRRNLNALCKTLLVKPNYKVIVIYNTTTDIYSYTKIKPHRFAGYFEYYGIRPGRIEIMDEKKIHLLGQSYVGFKIVEDDQNK